MEFALLIAESDVDRAVGAVRSAERTGAQAVWLLSGRELAEPRLVAEQFGGSDIKLVVQLDAREDNALPEGVDVIGAADPGWEGSLGALLAGGGKQAARGWLIARDIGTAAAAARAGVGAVLPELADLDAAADWVFEYEAELASNSARPVGDCVNARCAAIIELPDELGAAVGAIERLRQAGVSVVVLRGGATGDRELVAAVIGEFDDDEVRADQQQRQARLAPAIDAMEARRGSADADAGAPARKEGALGRWLRRHQEGFVGRMSDRQLDMVVGNRVGMRALMHTMAARFRPEAAAGFAGTIEFALETRGGRQVWSIDCMADGAIARRGESPDAELFVAARLADFLRVGTGEVSAPSAVLSGDLHVRGDFALALRMGDMFGGPSIV